MATEVALEADNEDGIGEEDGVEGEYIDDGVSSAVKAPLEVVARAALGVDAPVGV